MHHLQPNQGMPLSKTVSMVQSESSSWHRTSQSHKLVVSLLRFHPLEQQQYLYDKIREFCPEDCRDLCVLSLQLVHHLYPNVQGGTNLKTTHFVYIVFYTPTCFWGSFRRREPLQCPSTWSTCFSNTSPRQHHCCTRSEKGFVKWGTEISSAQSQAL